MPAIKIHKRTRLNNFWKQYLDLLQEERTLSPVFHSAGGNMTEGLALAAAFIFVLCGSSCRKVNPSREYSVERPDAIHASHDPHVLTNKCSCPRSELDAGRGERVMVFVSASEVIETIVLDTARTCVRLLPGSGLARSFGSCARREEHSGERRSFESQNYTF